MIIRKCLKRGLAQSIRIIEPAQKKKILRECILCPCNRFWWLACPNTCIDGTVEVCDRQIAFAANRFETRAPAVGVKVAVYRDHPAVGVCCFWIFARFELSVAEHPIRIRIVGVQLDSLTSLDRRAGKVMQRVHHECKVAMGGGEIRLEFQRFAKRVATQVEVSDVTSLPAFLDVEITQAIIEIGIWPLFQNFLKKQDVAIDGWTLRIGLSNTEKHNHEKCDDCSSDCSVVLFSWLHLDRPRVVRGRQNGVGHSIFADKGSE